MIIQTLLINQLQKREQIAGKVSKTMNLAKGLVLLLVLILATTQSHASFTDGCPETCGSMEIPYPFGIGKNCSLSNPFEISCQQGLDSTTPAPYLTGAENLSYQVLNFSNGKIRLNSTSDIASNCFGERYDSNDIGPPLQYARILLPDDGPFTISGSSNVFTVAGCNIPGTITNNDEFLTGCRTYCEDDKIGRGGTCSGNGCCEASITPSKRFYIVTTGNVTDQNSSSHCSYGFIVEKGGFVFEKSYLKSLSRFPDIAMVVDWSVGNLSCSNVTSNICAENSVCVNSDTETGYLCKCIEGYAGNAYLNGSKGCIDINECLEVDHHPCVEGASCVNTIPDYRCQCPRGSIGDGKVNGSGCIKEKTTYQHLKSVLWIVAVIIFAFSLCSWLLYSAYKKYKLMKLKEEYFRKNGGLALKQQLSRKSGNDDRGRIFSAKELQRATKNYCGSRILGSGGSGTVYKGVLKDGSLVAIKISKFMDQLQIDRFINEFVILTEINHRNVVRLLGCCLENEIPILVYEFISNGTLHSHIHERKPGKTLAWANRLRIAREIAEALSYLHSSATTPIFHRDVKPANILLDDNYSAKIADFGISKFVPLDQTQGSTIMQGTPGYMDPEYYTTYQLTEKSDVYSFGVLLVELLTGEMPVSLDRPPTSTSLAMYFISEMKNNDLSAFVDKNLLLEGCIEEIEAVSNVAWKCLLPKGDERPTMKAVALELAGIASCGRKAPDADEEPVCHSVSEGDDQESIQGELP